MDKTKLLNEFAETCADAYVSNYISHNRVVAGYPMESL